MPAGMGDSRGFAVGERWATAYRWRLCWRWLRLANERVLMRSMAPAEGGRSNGCTWPRTGCGALGLTSRRLGSMVSPMCQKTRSLVSWLAERDRLGAIDDVTVQPICINEMQVCAARPVAQSTH